MKQPNDKERYIKLTLHTTHTKNIVFVAPHYAIR